MTSNFPIGDAVEIRPASFNDIPFIKDIADKTWPVAYGTILSPAQLDYMLELTSVRERRYRGYCQPMDTFKPTFDLFNKLKDNIYKIYTDCPYIDEKYRKTKTGNAMSWR